MIREEDLVKIGQFAKPHGIKGEVSLITSFDLFDEDDEDPYIICELDGIFVPFFVEEFRYKSGTTILLKLENFDSDDSVKQFCNCDAYISRDKAVNTGVDEGISWDNFIGYRLYDEERGYLGEVEDVDDSTINVLFKVSYNNGELLIPVVEEIITALDHDARSIRMSVPQGLFEL